MVKKLDADEMRALVTRLDDLCIISVDVRKQLAKIIDELRALQEKIVNRTHLILFVATSAPQPFFPAAKCR